MTVLRPMVALAAAAALSACSTVGGMFGGDDETARKAPEDGRISILAFEQKLEADPALQGQKPALPEPVQVAEWSQPGGPPDNAPPHAAANGAMDIAWRKNVGDGSERRTRVTAAPVVANGQIYILNAAHKLYALNADTGAETWSVSLAPRSGRDRVALGGGVAFADGKLFVTSGFGFAAAFDPATGQELWRTPSRSPFHAAPTVSAGRMYAVNTDGELVALDAQTGASLWSYQAIAEPARILASSSPAVKGDAVIAPFASGQVIAFVPANGRRLWEDALTRAGRLTSLASINDVGGRPVAVDGFVYAASHSGLLAAIDQRTGQRVWARSLPSTQTPAVAGDTLYIVSTDSELTAIERTSGRVFWVSSLRRYKDEEDKKGRLSWAGPILVGGKLFLANSVGQGAFVDPMTGAVERTIDLGGPVFVPPITAGGAVYVMTDEGTLVALR